MTPQEFKQSWVEAGEVLSPIDSSRLKGLGLNDGSLEFLTISGLPNTVSPYLTFAKDTDDKFEGICRLTELFEFLEPEFSKYVVIGADGSGNQIAIDISCNDEIKWLDHEDYFSERFVNSSIHTLADYLTFYREFVDTILKENGDDAYVDSNFTDDQFEILKSRMKASEKRALIEQGFWKEELEMLLENRKGN